jgi:hypothetical protein
MITITIKGLSKAAHQALKKAIAVLEASVCSTPVNALEMIARARAARAAMPFKTTSSNLNRLIRQGRDRR